MAPDDNTSLHVPDSTGTNIPPVPNNPGDTTITPPPPSTKPSEESSGGTPGEDKPKPNTGVGVF
jgi:hypothetical protein